MSDHDFKVGDRVITTGSPISDYYGNWPAYEIGTVVELTNHAFIGVNLDNGNFDPKVKVWVYSEEIEHHWRDNNRLHTPEQLRGMNTKDIRSLYRFSERREDGSYWGGSGYDIDDTIGHQVINTVRVLCDKVDYLEGLLEDISSLIPGGRYDNWENDECWSACVAIRGMFENEETETE